MMKWNNLWISLQVIPGTHIRSAITDAINLATLLNIDVKLTFNDHEIVVPPGRDPELVYVEYRTKYQLGKTNEA